MKLHVSLTLLPLLGSLFTGSHLFLVVQFEYFHV